MDVKNEMENITITKIPLSSASDSYLMVDWEKNRFDLYLYCKNQIWKGKFSANRCAAFSRNLHVSEEEYFQTIQQCLGDNLPNYEYELKNSFFYWKRYLKDTIMIEGFLPVEMIVEKTDMKSELIDILLSINKNLENRARDLRLRFKTLQEDYEKCMRDTEEFINLKMDMEKTLCKKFLKLINVKKPSEEMKVEKKFSFLRKFNILPT